MNTTNIAMNAITVAKPVNHGYIAVSSWGIDLGEEETKNAGHDLLAIVCSLYRKGKKSSEVHDAVQLMHDNDSFSSNAEQCDIELADNIRKFYRQKIMMKSLATPEISTFDKIIEWIVSNPEHLYKPSFIRPLVKLPIFYKEDCETKKIIKNYTSVPEKFIDNISCNIAYVGHVRKNIARGVFDSYYFSTPDNYLLKVTTRVDKESISAGLLSSISKTSKKLKIDTDVVRTRVPGETFHVYEVADARKFVLLFE